MSCPLRLRSTAKCRCSASVKSSTELSLSPHWLRARVRISWLISKNAAGMVSVNDKKWRDLRSLSGRKTFSTCARSMLVPGFAPKPIPLPNRIISLWSLSTSSILLLSDFFIVITVIPAAGSVSSCQRHCWQSLFCTTRKSLSSGVLTCRCLHRPDQHR